MDESDLDTLMRLVAFEHVRRLEEINGHLTAEELSPGFAFEGERIPLFNPRRGIFKPRQMRFLLSIKTVFPRPGARVWYDDQREVHRQIFESDEAVDYAFMGENPEAADNQHAIAQQQIRKLKRYDRGPAPTATVQTFGLDIQILRQ